jgi:hypothetical protein
MFFKGVGQKLHIARGQVEAFGACRRHDVGGVSGQKQAAKTHGLGHKTAQGRNAFFNAGAGDYSFGQLGV